MGIRVLKRSLPITPNANLEEVSLFVRDFAISVYAKASSNVIPSRMSI